jgi:FKBP-type peptidyl-prolyl cis-trans isomerase 2
MMRVKNGCKIKVEYVGKLGDGTVFDSSEKSGKVLEFTVGDGQVIPGFEEGIVGMEKGEEKDFEVGVTKAYGKRDENKTQQVPRDQLPIDNEPKVGMILMLNTPDGKQIPLRIMGVDKETITIDLNHPLAGKKLLFHVKVVGIEK